MPLSFELHAPYLFGVNFEATELDAPVLEGSQV